MSRLHRTGLFHVIMYNDDNDVLWFENHCKGDIIELATVKGLDNVIICCSFHDHDYY